MLVLSFANLKLAKPWLRESQLLTKDELALAIVGHWNVEGNLQHRQIQLPCVDQNKRPVILACTLVQLGEKRISEGDCNSPSHFARSMPNCINHFVEAGLE